MDDGQAGLEEWKDGRMEGWDGPRAVDDGQDGGREAGVEISVIFWICASVVQSPGELFWNKSE
ncbi:MAG: hypothetical protein P8X95_10740 [Anaerolineales bacterium]|jgi:hypothetical protein